MRPTDAEQKIKEYGPLIDAALFDSKIREYTKLGYPSQSMGDGRGTSEPPLPMIGTTDRRLSQDRSEYHQALIHAALALETAHRLQTYWCLPVDTDTEKAKKLADTGPKGSGACANIWCAETCTGFGNDRLRLGRCRACYRIFKEQGKDRDPRKEGMAS